MKIVLTIIGIWTLISLLFGLMFGAIAKHN